MVETRSNPVNQHKPHVTTEKIMKRTTSFGFRRASVIAVTLAAGALLLSGCAATATATPATSAASGSASSAPSGQPAAGRGVSGLIASVSDGTLQVQSGTTQTAVTYTASTTIKQAVSAAASAVTVGSCVIGITTPNAAAASTVAISAAVNGTCENPAGRGGGAPGGGQGGARPSGAPGAGGGTRPSGAPGGGGFTRPVAGIVTAVTGTDITVSTTSQTGSSGPGTIKLDASTKYTTEQAATAAALVVNKCVAATGTADNSGNFAATALSITDPGANGCGLGGRPGGANG